MMEGPDKADGHDGHSQLLRKAEAAFFKVIDMAVAGALGFGKNDQADAAVDGFLGESPKPLQVLGAADAGHRHVAEALHQPAVHRNAEMGFKFPTANELRDGAIKDEGIEQVDVVHHEK